MKHGLLSTLGFILVGMVAFGSTLAKAQTVAPGPYYANPSWDQTLACTTLANCPRFIVLSNMGSAAVLDRETGLVWERSPSTSLFNWFGAHTHCLDLNAGGRTGWRLPTIQELMSLVDRSVSPGPTLPNGHPFTNVQSSFYWSATSGALGAPDSAYSVNLNFGTANLFSLKGLNNVYVWCARGGQRVDPQ